MAIDYKEFDKRIITFLKKQPQRYGDISHIANEFINGDQSNKRDVIRQLHYLKDRQFITIKDLPDNPMQMQDDWWGTLLGHNVNAGYVVEDLKAQLSTEYEKLSWWDKNKTTAKVIDWTVPFVLGILATLFTMKSIFDKDKPKDSLEEKTKDNKEASKQKIQKDDEKNTTYDSLRHNKYTLKDTLTKH